MSGNTTGDLLVFFFLGGGCTSVLVISDSVALFTYIACMKFIKLCNTIEVFFSVTKM